MDGNRRWAIKNGLIPSYGHKKGLEAVSVVVDFCLNKKIRYLSLYTFSVENLNRSTQEIVYLFEVLANQAVEELAQFKQKSVNIRFIGDRSLFPKNVRPLCEKIEKETQECNELYMVFLLCYGGTQEIIDTAKRIAIKVKKGDLHASDITIDVFENFLWTAGIPNPDLIIRTGGYRRMSNFLLFQGAYSELYFLDCLWPDITKTDLDLAVTYFNDCQRNFGQ